MENNKAELNGNYIAFTSGDPMSLTKREYFAGLAMQGILAQENPGRYNPGAAKCVADDAVLLADALLTAISSPNLLNK